MGTKVTSQDLERHLLAELIPFWHERGIDRNRQGFHDVLDEHGQPVERPTKRLLVQARQTYVFSHAFLLGKQDWALNDARMGCDVLQERYWDHKHGGWFSNVSAAGEPVDRRKDTYNHAFVLFAMAYYHRASGDVQALRMASATLDVMEQHLADPVGGGFMERAEQDWTLIEGPRRQNPHMHLFEAFLALYEASGEPRYLQHARKINQLFQERLFDPAHSCLGEYFDRAWKPQSGEEGNIVEPGHHFEWVWLLHQFARITHESAALEFADKLFSFAARWGVDAEAAGVFDQVDRAGKVLKDGKRLWPQTEFVTACAARCEDRREPEALARMQGMLDLCYSKYINPVHHGWREHFQRDWTLSMAEMPATSVYHIVLGLSEAARVLRAQERPQ